MSPRLAPLMSPAARRPLIAAAAYGVVVVVLLAVTLGSVADLLARRSEVNAAAAVLDRLRGRPANGPGAEDENGGPGTGSPFLEGPSLTVAGAALLQRLSEAVARSEGRLTSSRVELTDEALGADFVGVEASFDIQQAQLQGLIYDLEANQPFLFISRFAARAKVERSGGREETDEGQDKRLEITLTVYGRWRGAP